MAGGGGGGVLCDPIFFFFFFFLLLLLGGDFFGGDGETTFAAPAPAPALASAAPASVVAPASSTRIGCMFVGSDSDGGGTSCADDGSVVASIVGPGASSTSCGAARCFFFCFLLGVEPEPPLLDFFFDRLPISQISEYS